MIDVLRAIKSIKADAQVGCHNEDVNRLEWYDGNPTGITSEQIAEKQAVLAIQAEEDATAKSNRLVSVKSKLEALGLTTEEVKDAFGL